MTTAEGIDLVARRLADAKAVVAFTGAGVSVESGVPTFRGADGIWNKFSPEELASMDAFMKNPDLVWEWYAHRQEIIASTQPNAGHIALARLEQLVDRFTLVTQNIDNLHRRAGSRTVRELHGNIERSYCMRCGTRAERVDMTVRGTVPRCACGGALRPDVVWFGEMLPQDQWGQSVADSQGADVFLSIGTSTVVYPAAFLPFLAKRSGAFVAEVNPEPTSLTPTADVFLQGPAGTILPAIVEQYETLRRERDEERTRGDR